jgi:hypothetical protein
VQPDNFTINNPQFLGFMLEFLNIDLDDTTRVYLNIANIKNSIWSAGTIRLNKTKSARY